MLITPQALLAEGILPAMELLPASMWSVEAYALMLAIALQESGLRARRQQVWSRSERRMVPGPARSLYQFELVGLEGVLRHPATQRHAARLVDALGYADITPAELLDRMVDDDVLASGMARLNLFWYPAPLPARDDGPTPAYVYYDSIWRPGVKRPNDWPPNWVKAWDTVE